MPSYGLHSLLIQLNWIFQYPFIDVFLSQTLKPSPKGPRRVFCGDHKFAASELDTACLDFSPGN